MQSKQSPSSQHSVPSPDGAFIAILQRASLNIANPNGEIFRSIPLSADTVAKCQLVRWDRLHDKLQALNEDEDGQTSFQCDYILLACDDTVYVYNIQDPKWSTIVNKASSNLGRIADVSFGYTSNELLVFSDFGIKLTIWSLVSSRGVEIRDPKYMVQCYSHRPKTGHMAILTRPAVQDILLLLDPGNHTLFKSIEIPTVDAQEVAWSPDGQWLAIRDAASSGHKLFIYTADGHIFKTYMGLEPCGDIGLGIKRMGWNPFAGLLAVGDYNENVTLLSKNTFSPIARLHHPVMIQSPHPRIWQEQVDHTNERSYTIAPQPASPPTSTPSSRTPNPPRGISVISFSADGSLLATKDDMLPTSVWIWSLNTLTVIAILIHHSPVKHMAWHPTEADLLLIHCAIPEPSVHIWKSSWEAPRIVAFPVERRGGRLEAYWLLSPQPSQFKLLLSSAHQFALVLFSHFGEPILQKSDAGDQSAGPANTGIEDMFDEGQSLDLSPNKIIQDETICFGDDDETSQSGFGTGNELIDDTFHYRRRVRALG